MRRKEHKMFHFSELACLKRADWTIKNQLISRISSWSRSSNMSITNNLGRRSEYLTLLPTTLSEFSSDFLDSTQERHIGPTLPTNEEGKHPMVKIILPVSTKFEGKKKRKNNYCIFPYFLHIKLWQAYDKLDSKKKKMKMNTG